MVTNNDMISINKFMNVMWKWIRATQIPHQTDNEAWEAVDASAHKLVHDFEAEYKVSPDLHQLFIRWVNDYRQYAGAMSEKPEGSKT